MLDAVPRGIDVNVFLDAMDKDFEHYPQLKEYIGALTEQEKKTIRAYAEVAPDIELPMNHRYCYCIADRIDIAEDWQSELEWNDYKNIDTATLEKFDNVVVGVFTDLCNMYENWGYDELYDVDDEELAYRCEEQEWEFYEDGELYNA